LLLDWLEGVRLDELTGAQPARSTEEFELRLEFAIEACRTVGLLHERRFKHRDVKPDNLLARNRNSPRAGVALLDLGLTTQPRGYEEGTRGYQAPEQLGNRNLNLSTATDVFALAQVTWYLLTGGPRDPIQAEGREGWHTLGATLTELLPALPARPALEQVLDRAFAFHPGQRPAHANALAGALRATQLARRR
jgi:serine/threonine protein kinase